MRSLLLTTVSPADPRQGDEWRVYGLLAGLKELGSVDVIQWGGRVAGAHRVVPDSVRGRVVRALTGLSAGLPLSTTPYRTAFPRVENGPYDLVAAYPLKAARWALHVPAGLRLLDLTDSLGLLRERLPGSYRSQRLRLLGAGREEIRLGQQFTECWVASAQDAEYLAEHGLPAVVVPNGARRRNPLPWADPTRLLFVGNLAYPPNRNGLERFLRTVWPALSSRGFRLDVVGNGTESFRSRHVENVKGHGRVDDLEPFYRSHGVVIAPIEVGAGTPSKVLEALSFGRPVVGWTSGLGGLSACERRAVLVVDDTEGWSSALTRLRIREQWEELASLAPASVAIWGEPQAARLQALIAKRASTTTPTLR